MSRWATAVVRGRADHERVTLQHELQATQAQLQALQADRNSLVTQVEDLHRRVAELLDSTSWRVTKPLRAASAAVSRARDPG